MANYDAFNEYERTMWSSPRAAAYEQGLVALTAHMAHPLLDAVEARRGVQLLDVGTGPGVVAEQAAIRGCGVVGVDVSPQMLQLARANVPDAEFREGSAEALPAADAGFDAVVGNFIVLHLGYPERLANESARVLRPGGRVAFTVWAEGERNRVLSVFPEALARAEIPAPSDIPEGPLSVLFADHAKFRALLEVAGFIDVEIREHDWTHTVDPDAWWNAIVASTPRTGALIARQPESSQTRLRATYDELIHEYRNLDGTATLTVAAVLATGRRR
jgi:SAM-dependent methyltransferase